MEPSLDGSYLRVKRAGQHIGTLKRLQGGIAEIDAGTIVIHENTNPPKQLDARTIEHYSDSIEIPGIPSNPQWSINTSEAVFNLRAALDYLVYSLAHLDSGKERSRTQFPICSDICEFKDAIKKGQLSGLSQSHRAAIEGLQPYKGGKWLNTLASISNPDKHRKLVATAPRNAINSWLTEHPAPADGRQVAMQLHLTRYIAFSDESPVIPTLDALKAQVADTIRQFDAEFERQKPIPPRRDLYRVVFTITKND